MARAAKTIKQHLLEGTLPQGKPERASVYSGGRPQFPKHLSKIARAEMKRCVRVLEKRRTITEGDFATLAVYAEVYARWIQGKTEVGDSLLVTTTITDNHGTARTVTRLHPLLKVVQHCEARMLSLLKVLGLTPMDRDRVKQTADGTEEIVPGSVADQYPELFGRPRKQQASNIVPISGLDMVEEEEQQ